MVIDDPETRKIWSGWLLGLKVGFGRFLGLRRSDAVGVVTSGAARSPELEEFVLTR